MKNLIGILGMGISGKAALSHLIKSNSQIVVYDDKIKSKNSFKNYWKHYSKWNWEKLKMIVISPGINLTGEKKHPIIDLAKKNGVKLINEIDLFFQQKPNSIIIGITGTNGKSTIVSLISHILNENKIQNKICGNFGYPVCSLDPFKKNNILIIELSSFQLLSIPNLKVDYGIITNISNDHLDFHGDFNSYLLAKLRLIDSIKPKGKLIINHNEKFLKNCIEEKIKHNSAKPKVIYTRGMQIESKNLFGKHNQILFEMAFLICKQLQIKPSSIKSSILSFKSLPHRMETIYKSKFLTIINDSKATNGNSATAALKTFKNIHWIAGGLEKEDGLGEALKNLSNVEAIYLTGKSVQFFKKQLIKDFNKEKIFEFKNLKELIDFLFNEVQKYPYVFKTILFSPAAASFDEYQNFEERGKFFKDIIRNKLKVTLNVNFPFR